MEKLKPAGELLSPDFRSASRGCSLEVLHKLAARHELTSAVPDGVRHQFEIARHAFVYSALYTPLCAAAELFAALAIEHALRLRFQASDCAAKYSRPRGLKDLLSIAAAEGWIANDGFAFDLVASDAEIGYEDMSIDRSRGPTDIVIDVLPALRNSLAHGRPRMTLEFVGTALLRATEIINQLYPIA